MTPNFDCDYATEERVIDLFQQLPLTSQVNVINSMGEILNEEEEEERMTDIPNFEEIARALESAAPLEMAIEPYRAYCLVSLLQLTLRHPGLKTSKRAIAEVARSMIVHLESRLGEISPAIKHSLEMGDNESLDMTDDEWQDFQDLGIKPSRGYSALSLEHQEEVVLNGMCLEIAANTLAHHVGGEPLNWIQQIAREAKVRLEALHPDEVKRLIADLDSAHLDQVFGDPPEGKEVNVRALGSLALILTPPDESD